MKLFLNEDDDKSFPTKGTKSTITQEKNSLETLCNFITGTISDGWETINRLKMDIEFLKSDEVNDKTPATYLQDLLDSYLICIGRLTNYLSEEKIIDYPEETFEEPAEDAVNNKTFQEIADSKRPPKLTLMEPDDYEEDAEVIATKLIANDAQSETAFDFDEEDKNEFETHTNKVNDDTDYVVDFPEPDFTKEKLTDEDIYGDKE